MSVPSPCVDVCKIDGSSGFCIGCLRTRDEIRAWKHLSDAQRLQVIGERAQRMVQMPAAVNAADAASPATSASPRQPS